LTIIVLAEFYSLSIHSGLCIKQIYKEKETVNNKSAQELMDFHLNPSHVVAEAMTYI